MRSWCGRSDQGDFYRVPVDSRDLNYGAYLDEGDPRENAAEDFHSHNTERLGVDEVAALLESAPRLPEAAPAGLLRAGLLRAAVVGASAPGDLTGTSGVVPSVAPS